MSFGDERRGRPERAREHHLRVMRERIVALVSLILVAAIVLVIVFSSMGGSGSHHSKPASTTSAGHPRRARSAPRAVAQRGTATVPILVYHVINSRPTGSTALPALYVPADEFAAQMQALKANGWHAVTLNQLEDNWTRGASLGPGKPIVITFDNGYASQYTNALPVLKKLGWAGVENLQLTGLPPSEGGLTDDQIRALVASGWELDTQGLSHTDLITLDPAQLSAQVATARQTLRNLYRVPVNWFSYPSGDYNPTVIAAAQAAGYAGATTVNPGWASPQQSRFQLPGLVVVGGTSPSQLLAQVMAAQSTTSVPPSYSGTGLA
jgi:peptidoglycan/xylan/chitin deacetylase (PgdA/CDA1 family)